MLQGYVTADKPGWQIPRYAQDMLWVQCGDLAVQTSGPRGAFALNADGDEITLTWGTAEGPLLARRRRAISEPLILNWQGTVGVGGFVERLHVFETRELEVMVAEIEGDLLPSGYRRLPTLADMRAGVFRRSNDPPLNDLRPYTYTVLALADSIYAEYLHHAMVSELAVDCFATLGPHEGHWHEIVGLPLLVDGLSLLAPG